MDDVIFAHKPRLPAEAQCIRSFGFGYKCGIIAATSCWPISSRLRVLGSDITTRLTVIYMYVQYGHQPRYASSVSLINLISISIDRHHSYNTQHPHTHNHNTHHSQLRMHVVPRQSLSIFWSPLCPGLLGD